MDGIAETLTRIKPGKYFIEVDQVNAIATKLRKVWAVEFEDGEFEFARTLYGAKRVVVSKASQS